MASVGARCAVFAIGLPDVLGTGTSVGLPLSGWARGYRATGIEASVRTVRRLLARWYRFRTARAPWMVKRERMNKQLDRFMISGLLIIRIDLEAGAKLCATNTS